MLQAEISCVLFIYGNPGSQYRSGRIVGVSVTNRKNHTLRPTKLYSSRIGPSLFRFPVLSSTACVLSLLTSDPSKQFTNSELPRLREYRVQPRYGFMPCTA